jgi:hypothetical protein
MKYPMYSQHQQQQQHQFVSPSNVKYSLSSAPSAAYNRAPALSYGYNNNNNYYNFPQQLSYAASQPAAVSYVQSPFHLAQQIFAHQLPLANYNVHQVAPIIHSPNAGFLGSYQQQHHHHQQQAPVSAYHHHQTQPQTFAINKIPQYPTYYNQHQPQTLKQQQQQQGIITSKPVAVETPLASTSSSASNEVHHNQHGAVSYAAFKLPSAAGLIATSSPHQHQQSFIYPQSLDYGKHLSSAYPLHPVPPANYFAGYAPAGAPYAHISRISVIPTPVVPAPQVLSVSVVPTIPQKISHLH